MLFSSNIVERRHASLRLKSPIALQARGKICISDCGSNFLFDNLLLQQYALRVTHVKPEAAVVSSFKGPRSVQLHKPIIEFICVLFYFIKIFSFFFLNLNDHRSFIRAMLSFSGAPNHIYIVRHAIQSSYCITSWPLSSSTGGVGV